MQHSLRAIGSSLACRVGIGWIKTCWICDYGNPFDFSSRFSLACLKTLARGIGQPSPALSYDKAKTVRGSCRRFTFKSTGHLFFLDPLFQKCLIFIAQVSDRDDKTSLAHVAK